MMSIHSQPPVAMPGYSQIYTERGRLFYLPDHLLRDDTSHSRGLFQGRRGRPHRIHIARVAAELPEKTTGPSTRSIIFGKLAAPRDNAKRLLRSIASSQKTKTPSDSPAQSQTKRLSRNFSLRSSRATSPAREAVRQPETLRQNMRGGANRHSVAGNITAMARPPTMDTLRVPSNLTIAAAPPSPIMRAIPDEKPVAAGNGVSVGILLAEPVLFLQGFEQNDTSSRSTAMLRGSLHLRVQKASKIKAITLKFKGKAITKWPEGIPPKKVDFEEIDTIMSHTWPFFNAQFPTAESGPCADHVSLHSASTASVDLTSKRPSLETVTRISPTNSTHNLSPREAKRLSLQANHSRSRSTGKGDVPSGPTVAQKGYRTFQPGDYIYNFELPLDSHLPETIDVELGSVKYELEASVERSGAFRANLLGTKEVQLIRAPSEGSLEQVEPIAISRNWEDQLHYDIVISGKSFPLGAQVPIAFKLTPLAKVQCHRIKVFVTENIEYFCNNKRVHRMEPTRKIQLFEKRPDGPPTSAFPGSSMRIISGGGLSYDQRAAAARGESVTPSDSTNLLGNLEGDYNIGPTEMEFNVQLPSCMNMKEKEKAQKLHFDTTYQNIQVHHWIKIVMRLSKPDANDPGKRRHFEISIDSPFHILSCRATQANTALPAYSSPESASDSTPLYECGCPGSAMRRSTPTSFVPTLNNLNPGSQDDSDRSRVGRGAEPARPQQAHIGGPTNQPMERPIHLLRAPSFNPPSFEEEEPPPPLETPPPQYNDIASPTTGLADYFSRLAEFDDDSDSESGSTPGRVRIPLAPGSRLNRSMDERRTWEPLGYFAQG